MIKPRGVADIPYRSLIPMGVGGLLVAGRCISADWYAFSGLRGMPTCMAIGQAAGTAAALSIGEAEGPRGINVKVLQEVLIEQGASLGI